MSLNKKESTLELLSQYKWDDEYQCYKCGHNEYKKGGEPFGRRCKKCDYDESVLKFTGFESLKIPIEKAVEIISYLIDEGHLDYDKKGIRLEKQSIEDEDTLEDRYNVGESISPNELLERYSRGDIKRETSDLLLHKFNAENRLILSEIANRFEIEENTLNKLIERIAKRTEILESHHLNYENTTPFEIVSDFFQDGRYDLNYVLGMLMFPMDDTWVKGKKKVNRKWYCLCPPSRVSDEMRWDISLQIFPREDANGNWIFFYNKEDEPEYREDENSTLI